nr:RHS repeat-associated core domain-containing protein [Boseongicola sp. H5]
MAVSVSTGAVAAEYDYDSFGQRTLVQGTEEVRYGFTAREHDARTGLIHYRARAYDPLTGQFLQRDPIGFASGDLNLYAYVENDPANSIDPSGLIEGSVTTARSAGMSSGLGGIFNATLGLANNIRTALMSTTSLTSVTAAANVADRALSCASGDVLGCAAGRTVDRVLGNAFERAGEFGIQSYRDLRRQIQGSGLEAHHLIEQRFARRFGMNPRDMPSIALTRAEHQPFTNRWRREFPYGSGTNEATRERVLDFADQVYSDYPDILAHIRETFGR